MKKLILLGEYNLEFNVEKLEFSYTYSNEDVIRYFKGRLGSLDRFMENIINKLNHPYSVDGIEEFKIPNELIENFIKLFGEVEPFTYQEAFKIEDDIFRIMVFSSIDISEMVKNMGAKRIKTDGMEVNHKQYDYEGNHIGDKTYDVVYEIHEADGTKLGLKDEKIYALKCWCTSTNQEHYLWIEDNYKDNPLEAVASTFRVHENVIPYIKEIKRQGDVLLVELKESIKDSGLYDFDGNMVGKWGKEVPLTADQFFGYLTAQS